MKGFKPVGRGPSMGFKFPASMGFTGSTGSVTNVSPHVRRKAFANGGFVRQDNPRMKSAVVGDSGSALVRRSKPTTQLDQESGGRSPLRPGFKKGGYTGGGALGAARAAEAKRTSSPGGIKGKFAAARGGKMRKADGGKIEYAKPSAMEALRENALRLIGVKPSYEKKYKPRVEDKYSGRGRLRQTDDAAYEAETGRKRNYARGGEVKKKAVSAAEAKQIAKRTVGEHVRHPAPKGHKGLERVMRKADGGDVRNTDDLVVRHKPGERRKTRAEMFDEAEREWRKRESEATKDRRPLEERMKPL